PIALDLLRRVRRLTDLPLIASGGIMTLADARERLDAGASLVQLYTGFVYCGPQLVRDIAAIEGRPIGAE
ncbi:MAG: quinone-dependent dihydroorotate dehydrogenase, partial [Actinobacteria bacterium]|nr:quinone-dependent dihydroorotate dehydrogenase [Actinomycetota bacterium]NIU71583.1 quinone-dependent dihydroorotate dehydrogenase [Actinomycetota bacterium]NIW33538.1 quinone-dependent dihydroorotate dehydrogenase [Actinomycetota bacterium]